MKAIINAKVVTENSAVDGGILFDERICEIGGIHTGGAEVIDACGAYVIPGFVDVHIHGYKGSDTSDGDINGIESIAKALTANGVTAWCPTTMTVSMDEIQTSLDQIGELMQSGEGARVLGANVEGPFINPEKKGAQSAEFVKSPNADFIIKNKDRIKLVTLAPEVDGGIEFIKRVTAETDVNVSVGHTAANFNRSRAAFDAGARHVTHLFNAMPPLGHREPGVVGAALADDRVYCELIADTFHINPVLFKILDKVIGDRLVLITDCMRAGGMPDGEYTLGGQPVSVHGIECRLTDGTIAGSILTMNKAVKNFMDAVGCPIWEAVKKASLNPARSVGEEKNIGSLAVGKRADIVICDSNIKIQKTIIGGSLVYNCNM